jgi:hypothetical protein
LGGTPFAARKPHWTSVFAAKNEENAKAIDESFRPSGYTPAFGREVTPFGAVIYGTRERVPFHPGC